MPSIKNKVIWDRLFRILSKITFLFFFHSIQISVKMLVEILFTSTKLHRSKSSWKRLENTDSMIFFLIFDFSLCDRLKLKLFGIFQNFIEDNFLISLPFHTNICENVRRDFNSLTSNWIDGRVEK